ncbi:MAG: hypothetical protein AAGE76_15275 [Pseudomonadota bacterium]
MRMIEMIFSLMISGCSDDGGECRLLAEETLRTTRVACEARLEARLRAMTATWPVYEGFCVRQAQQVVAAATAKRADL